MRTVILCVNSVWDLDPATVPPAETQGNILSCDNDTPVVQC